MNLHLWAQTLYQERFSLLVWTLAIAAVSGMYTGFFMLMANEEMSQAMDALPPELMHAIGMQDISSQAGYLEGTVFGMLAPILIIIFAVIWGSRFIAGDEATGILDLLLAHPVSRTSLFIQRYLVMVAGLLVLGLAVIAAIAAIAPFVDLDIRLSRLCAASLHLTVLGLLAGTAAMSLGGITGNRSIASGGTAAIMVLSWMANVLATQSDKVEWLKAISVFHYYSGGRPIVGGVQASDLGVLLSIIAALLVSGVVMFQRRDLMV